MRERGLDDWLVVDVNVHHFERQSWAEVVECIPGEVVRDIAKSFGLNHMTNDCLK